VTVYITEAHAADEWPVGKTISAHKQPTSTQERCGLASEFSSTRLTNVPMLVDNISNGFQKAFAAWPFRYYLVKDGKIVHKAQPSPVSLLYDITELSTVLSSLASKV